jgi:hypothetical protein
MRRKMNCYEVSRWTVEHISTCDICDEKAEYRYNIWHMFNNRWGFLCQKHAKEWERGDLNL